MKTGILRWVRFFLVLGLAAGRAGAQDTGTNGPLWLSHPLTMTEALNLALQQNGNVLRGKSDLEAQYGLVVQTRAVAIPKLAVTGNYTATTETEQFPFPNPPPTQDQTWAAHFQVTQAIYQGGQIRSALRSAKMTKEEALLNYETVLADALLQARIAYYDVLSAADQVGVEEASVKLLTQQLDDQTRRYEAGTVPRFNVLQAQVELSNEKPKLIQAHNVLRVAKNNLVNQMGEHIPTGVQEDVPLELADKLNADAYSIELTQAIAQALKGRTELLALRKQELVEKEAVITAQGNYKPTVSLSGGYGAHNTEFDNNLSHAVPGWTGGAQLSWSVFDGLLTAGKVEQAKALYEGAKVDVETRRGASSWRCGRIIRISSRRRKCWSRRRRRWRRQRNRCGWRKRGATRERGRNLTRSRRRPR